MQTLLVHISGTHGQAARLQASFDIARVFSGQVMLCQPAPPAMVATGLAPGNLAAVVNFEDLEAEAVAQRQAVKSQIIEQMRQEDVPWEWVDVRGFAAEAFVSQTSLADLAVVTLAEQDAALEGSGPFLSHVVTYGAAPVLAVPSTLKAFDPLGTVLIAWDGSFEAAKAVKAALPLLQKASSVMAVTIGSSNASRPDLSDLARYLSRAGVHIEADTIPAEGHVSTQLMQQAKAINAAYIVMGAYSRSRLLETILGGETQRMLAQDEIAVLFAH